ncbi:right-handed parallel beta-helix repeat-containing protein [Aquimarina rhabdastrellae]
MKQITLILVVFFFGLTNSFSQTIHVIPEGTKVADGAKMNVAPGDIVLLEAGEYPSLVMKNFNGTAANPIIIKNQNGKAVVAGGDYFTFSFRYCSYIRVTGTGDPNETYGIEVKSPDLNSVGNGVGMGSFCKNIEIDHLEIHRVDFAGIMIKTDPTCDPATQRGNFQIDYIKIHDNKIYDTGGEAMYIGYSTYYEVQRDCDNDESNGKETTVLPHEIMNLKIWNNTIYDTGREGIQIGCVRNYEIYDNTITNYGMEQLNSHQNAVQLGQGCAGIFRNNVIKDGFGHGLTITALENTTIANNVIINSGSTNPNIDETWTGFNPPAGINLHDKNMLSGTSYRIVNNTIINPRANGIYMYGKNEGVAMHEYKNNLILKAGGAFSNVKYNAAMYIEYPKYVAQKGNYFGQDLIAPKFVDAAQDDYRLQSTSFLTDAGETIIGLTEDFDYQNRPQGNGYDIGAFENTNQATVLDPFPANACQCDHVITIGIEKIDGENYNFLPGEKICIEGGVRNKLELKNIQGTANTPIEIVNCGDVVTIANGGSINLDNVKNIRFTGTGITNELYGFKVLNSSSNAFTVNDLSTAFKIDHVWIENAKNYGIYSKDDPRCDLTANKDNFVMQDVSFEDIVIKDSKRGIQIGHPRYALGKSTTCDGVAKMLYPYQIKNLNLKRLSLTNIKGGDGINLYGCDNAVIEENILDTIHSVGIYAGTHSNVTLRRNSIKRTGKEGFRNTGSGTAKLYTNVFYDTGENGNYSAIKFPFQQANGAAFGNVIDVQFNTVVDFGAYGVHVVVGNNATNNCIVSNNIFSDATTSSFIKVNQANNFTIAHNILEHNEAIIYFEDISQENFKLTSLSPAIDFARNPTETIDFDGNIRIVGSFADAGAYEYTGTNNLTKVSTQDINEEIQIYPTLVESRFFIQTEKYENISYSVYNIYGIKVAEGYIKNEKQLIDVEDMNEGIYLLRIKKNDKIIAIKKIIKQ